MGARPAPVGGVERDRPMRGEVKVEIFRIPFIIANVYKCKRLRLWIITRPVYNRAYE